jgi:hypothetical protein
MNCPKCASTFLQVCVGYSQEDSRGDAYRYVFCIMCGFVQHQLRADECTVQLIERIRLLPDTFVVNH